MNGRRGEDPLFPKLSEDERIEFPDPSSADEQGILCVGGNLSPGMLLSAYSQGIFPWYSEEDPLLWWSPDPRFVLFPREIRVSQSMRKVLRKGRFSLSLDTDFRGVIEACASTPRKNQRGTWITPEMTEAYVRLHELGFAHSVETRLDGNLVGGLYGVSLGRLFCGESMFSREPNASKAAVIALAWRLADEGFAVMDSQVRTDHVASLGGQDIPRAEYLALAKDSIRMPSSRGDWGSLFPDFPRSTAWETTISRGTDQTHRT